MTDMVGARLQGWTFRDQVISLARLLEERSSDGYFLSADVTRLMEDIGLPRPPRIRDVLSALEDAGLITRVGSSSGSSPRWKLTPRGRLKSRELLNDLDASALLAEMGRTGLEAMLGSTRHPTIPPELAPPAFLDPLAAFLSEHPFDRNVFGMTRFPAQPHEELSRCLETARAVCADHGLEFHLASDRQLVDDLWSNVAAHMWASRYGVAFFEDRVDRGVNYNLTIEVGGCLMAGRRIAILKDTSVAKLPTDLVGHIYKGIDLADTTTVRNALETWIEADLAL